MTRILLISGSHSRHLHVMSQLVQLDASFRAIVMERESVLPEPPTNTDLHDQNNFSLHFQNRLAVETHTFGILNVNDVFSGIETHICQPQTLNSSQTAAFVKSDPPDSCIIFGCDIISGELLAALPEFTLNFHLGLSPWYRGSATLFWPFYFMEPQCAGVTIHKIVAAADAGQIIHQSVPVLKRGMGIHDVGVSAVVQGTADLVSIITKFLAGVEFKFTTQKSMGRLFLTRDFEPHHLRVNYDIFEDRMVDQLIDGKLGAKLPKLVSNI